MRTVKETIENYITSKEAIYSLSTVAKLRSLQVNNFGDINSITLDDLTDEDVQKMLENLGQTKSIKVVKETYNLLLSATGRRFKVDFTKCSHPAYISGVK